MDARGATERAALIQFVSVMTLAGFFGAAGGAALGWFLGRTVWHWEIAGALSLILVAQLPVVIERLLLTRCEKCGKRISVMEYAHFEPGANKHEWHSFHTKCVAGHQSGRTDATLLRRVGKWLAFGVVAVLIVTAFDFLSSKIFGVQRAPIWTVERWKGFITDEDRAYFSVIMWGLIPSGLGLSMSFLGHLRAKAQSEDGSRGAMTTMLPMLAEAVFPVATLLLLLQYYMHGHWGWALLGIATFLGGAGGTLVGPGED